MSIAGQSPGSPPTSTVAANGGIGLSSSPWRRNAYVYAPCNASAPVAKFRTPELRYVTTSAIASAAKTAPLPKPSNRKLMCSVTSPDELEVLYGPQALG